MKTLPVLLSLVSLSTFQLVRSVDAPPALPLPKVSVVASDPTAFAGISSGAFTIYRDGTNNDLLVNFALSGTASNGVDYVKIPEFATIPAGFHGVQIVVQPTADGAGVAEASVKLNISTNADYARSKPASAVVEIKGDAFEDQAPAVSISAPADKSSFSAKSNLTITTETSDADDSIAKVSFYANDLFLGTTTAAPFSFVWTNVPAGAYALFARAQNKFGKSTLSAAVHVKATNAPPAKLTTVEITSPKSGSRFSAPANIDLAASVGDSIDGIAKVNFYSGNTLIGSATASPYTLTWSNVPPGEFTLEAKAIATEGTVYVSPKVKIAVTNTPPVVAITSPAPKSTFNTPTNLTVTATATSADPISTVMFFANSRFLGTSKTAPFSFVWTNVPPGKYSLTARATDSLGTSAVSSTVGIVVSNALPAVSITSPATGSSFTAPAKIELTAEASDADGIKAVSFWSGKTLIAVRAKAPYSVTLNNVKAGSYTFTAQAIDKFEQASTSAPVKVTVAAARKP